MNDKLIYKQICAVMGDIDAIGKNQKNTGQHFMFRGIDDVYNSLHDILAKHQIFTVPTVISEDFREEIYKSGGKGTRAILKIKYTVYAADGSSIDGVVIGEALDSGDKAANKAMAIAHKYFLTQTFIIPTQDKDNDPDASSHELQCAPQKTFMTTQNNAAKEYHQRSKETHLQKIAESETMEELKDSFAKAWKLSQQLKDDEFTNKVQTIYKFNKERLSNDEPTK